MKSEGRYCIIKSYMDEDNPFIKEILKISYKDKYIDKYSKIIDKDKLYPKDEANELLKNNSTFGFELATRNDYNRGIDMIEELAYLEERADLNFEVLNWNSIEDYMKKIKEQGYSFEKLTEKELEKLNKDRSNDEG